MLHCRSYIYVSFSKLSSIFYYKKFEQLNNIEYLIRRSSVLTLIPTILVSQLLELFITTKEIKKY